jgi:hypothetical protein
MSKMETRSILKILMLVVLMVMTSISLAEEDDTWTRKTDMPTRRLGLSSSVVDGKIYAIGGGNSIEGSAFRTVEEYDPVTDTWTTKTDMPTGRIGHAAGVVNGKIYVIGGAIAEMVITPTVDEYDPAMDTWTTKADMPTARCFLSTSVTHGKIYAIGGEIYPGDFSVPTVEEYDPATDTWIKKADMPTARSMLAASVLDGKIYVIGGVIGGVGGSGTSIVEEYDPVTDTWTGKTDMPTPRKALSASAVAGKIYASGGGSGHSEPFSALEEYDPATDTWTTKADMPIARYCHSTSTVDGRMYVFGGAVQYPPHTSTSTVEEYDPNPFVADLNGDEMVDFKDLAMLAQYWRQDQSPLGNRRLEYEELTLLADCWLTEILPGSLIARWKLDETEGFIAHDSVGDNDGTLIGEPAWRPTDGILNGALELDEIDDFVSTPFSLNPAAGPFSAFAWAKGGGPGQVVISQSGGGGVDWLLADAEGKLMTMLRRSSFSPTLSSEYVITDDDWHHIGFVWDGSHRHLYADGTEVAEDTADVGYLRASNGTLYIGAGATLDPGSFFSGLIDDVRIYDRAIVP